MQVAVKVLTSGASETDRVRFLQEAAIMGQFYHPNIVRLHGVITVGNPVKLKVVLMCRSLLIDNIYIVHRC